MLYSLLETSGFRLCPLLRNVIQKQSKENNKNLNKYVVGFCFAFLYEVFKVQKKYLSTSDILQLNFLLSVLCQAKVLLDVYHKLIS